jgi:hypothetical protein
MAKFLVFLVALAVLSFFLQQFIEALFLTTLIVFAVFFFLGIVFSVQGLVTGDNTQLISGLAMSLFSATYIAVSYYYYKIKKKEKS